MSDGTVTTRASRPTRDPTWSIRNMPLGEREQAIDASKRADMDIGEWLALAVRTRVAVERGEGRGQTVSDRASHTLPELSRLAEIAMQMATATGKPVPRSVSRLVYRELRIRLALIALVSDKLSDVGQIVALSAEMATPAGNPPDRRTEGECDGRTSQTPTADYDRLVHTDQGGHNSAVGAGQVG